MRRPPVAAPAGLDGWALARQFMQRNAGVVLAEDQAYLLEARVGPLARACATSLGDYLRQACAAPVASPLHLELLDALTTHETFFFRDAVFWRALEERVLPAAAAAAAAANRPVRVWSAACSTGQEPYSMVMLAAERFPQLELTVLGTDVAGPTLERARAGVFTPLEANRGLGAMRLVRHFEQVPGGFRVKAELRRRVTFERHNLLGAAPYPRADIVLCRNVLIYFDDRDRASVLERLVAASGAWVGVGCTEQLGRAGSAAPGWYEARLLRQKDAR